MDFFEQLLDLYSSIEFPEDYKELAKVDKAISWYFADSFDQYVSVSQTKNTFIVELDIKNAFYTICNTWFNPENEFLIELNKLTDKKSRNIFIATQLKDTPYLKQLNIICKIIVMGILFEIGKIQLLELKKDGAIITCDKTEFDKLNNLSELSNLKFINFINSKFTIKVDTYLNYIRCFKTSYFWNGTELIAKGTYKYIPEKIKQIQKAILKDEIINLKALKKIYSKNYFNIIAHNNLDQIMRSYYLCDNNKYILMNGKYYPRLIKHEIDPKLYLKLFVYPFILARRI